jgi:LPXTG-motif cell wall-anchored protein
MIRFSKLAAAMAVMPILAATNTAMAVSPGQLAGGSNVYLVKNLTQKGSYAATASAACGDEIQYSIDLHNTEFGALNNINVAATLASTGGNSTVTATPDAGGTTGTTGTVNVSVATGGTVSYENGSTTLFDGNGTVIKTLPDTITTSGVNVGMLNGSSTEFVNFKAKVSCSAPTPTTTTTTTPQVKSVTTLPNTGAGDVLGLFAGASGLGAAGHFVTRRSRR